MDHEVGSPKRPASPADDVLVSEAANYAFCAKAWHLEYVLRRSASTEAAQRRAEGTRSHHRHGARVSQLHRLGPRLPLGSFLLLVLAAVLFVLAVVASR